MIGVVLSLIFGIVYGVLTIAEYQVLRSMKAIDKQQDTEEELSRKREKTLHLRTMTACVGFFLALVNIGIEAFVDFT